MIDRYLQNEASESRELDVQIERSGTEVVNGVSWKMSRSENISRENNCKCSQRATNLQRDTTIPCINIILRSDCKMHSSQYNYMQKENSEDNEVSKKTDVKLLNVASLDLTDKKFNRTAFNRRKSYESRFDVLYGADMQKFQCKVENNQGNRDSSFNNVSQIRYNGGASRHSIHLNNEISSGSEIRAPPIKTDFFSKVEGTDLREMKRFEGNNVEGGIRMLESNKILGEATMLSSNRVPGETRILGRSNISGETYMLKGNNILEERIICRSNNVKTTNVSDNNETSFGISKFIKSSAKFCEDFPVTSSPINLKIESLKDADKSKTKGNSVKFLNDITNELGRTLENRADVIIGRNLKPSDRLSNFEVETMRSFLKPTSYKPRAEFSYISTFARLNSNRNEFMQGNGILNTVCTNKMDDICRATCGRYKAIEKRIEENNYSRNEVGAKEFQNLSNEKSTDFCTNASCNDAKCTMSLNTERLNKYVNTISTANATKSVYVKSEKDFRSVKCDNRCISTIDSALDILHNMLKGVKKFKDTNTTMQSDQNYSLKEVQCRNMDCNSIKGKDTVASVKFRQSSLNLPEIGRRECEVKTLQELQKCNCSEKEKINYANHLSSFSLSEILRPECMRMLQEIKKHTETLEEQLSIMNKSIKYKTKANKEFGVILEASDAKQRRDVVTQNPEKRNIHTQESYPYENLEYFQTVASKSESSFGMQSVKRRNKKNECEKGLSRIGEVEDENCRNYKEENFKSLMLMKCCNDDCSRNVKDVQIPCVRSLSFHMYDSQNFKPLATSTPKRKNPSQNIENVCNVSNCNGILNTQMNSVNQENLGIPEVKVKTENLQTAHKENSQIPEVKIKSTKELIKYPLKKKNKIKMSSMRLNEEQVTVSCSENATVVLLVLSKCVNSKCLKSRYKRSEFFNFKPKCIVKGCSRCGERSMKYRFSRQKVQIPVVFRLPSTRSKTEEFYCNEEIDEDFSVDSAESCKTSDLGRSVCTQSSNLQITTATSVPCVSFHNGSRRENCREEAFGRRDGCIVS